MAGGETANIAELAELLASKVFREFGWERAGPANSNFDCTSPAAHDSRVKHPCDVVFHYDDPYSEGRVYVFFDLKSFAAKSIQADQVTAALNSLAMAVECAGRSQQWQDRHANRTLPGEVQGCLFVYNHDNEYRGDFMSLVRHGVKAMKASLPPRRRLFVLGPADISYLHTLANDLRQLRGATQGIPPAEFCHFLYPELVTARRRDSRIKQASLELLTGPWQVLAFERADGGTINRGHVVHYRHAGRSSDEFLYLIDFLFRVGVLDSDDPVRLRMVQPHQEAPAFFERAVEEYADTFSPSKGFRKYIRERISAVHFEVVDAVVPQFSQVAVGMRRRDA